jgi:hypothetical protein
MNELLNKKKRTTTEYYTDEDVIKFNGLVSSLLFAGDIVKKKVIVKFNTRRIS